VGAGSLRPIPAALLPTAAAAWVVLLVAAPLTSSSRHPPLAAVAVYDAGALICHQQADRSFAIRGVPLPVCGRCTGLYLAAACGALAAWLARGRRPPEARTARLVLAVAALPMAVSIGLEWTGVAAGSNLSRFLSALPLGVAGGWVLQRTAERG
jgi:uncharacterized membrane protein